MRKIIYIAIGALLYGTLANQSGAVITEKERNMCKGIPDWTKCNEIIEQARIRKYSTFVKREGDTLVLTIGSDKYVRLKNVRDEQNVGNWVSYTFLRYILSIDYFLIEKSYYEGGAFALVDGKYGNIFEIDEIPIFAPNDKHFITVSICDAYCPYRLQIWELRNTGLNLVWSFTPYEYWANGLAKWLDDRTIVITKSVRKNTRDTTQGYIDKSFYLKLTPRGWKIEED